MVDGAEHKRQRKLLTPAFTSQRVGGLVPHFWKKGCELVEYLERNAVLDSNDMDENRKKRGFEVFNCLTRTTLDIIGLAGKSLSCLTISHLSLLLLIQPPLRLSHKYRLPSYLLSYRPTKPSISLSSSQIFRFVSSSQLPRVLTFTPYPPLLHFAYLTSRLRLQL